MDCEFKLKENLNFGLVPRRDSKHVFKNIKFFHKSKKNMYIFI